MEENLESELMSLKAQEEFKNTIHNTKNLIKRDTEYIPSADDLNEMNKGDWIVHDQSNFNKMFDGLLDYCADEECYDNLDWNSVNYEVYGPDYYQERFPGFADEVFEILAKSMEEDNKFVDNRIPPLKIENKETIISFK